MVSGRDEVADVALVVPPRNRRVPADYPARDNLGVAYLTAVLRQKGQKVVLIEANSDGLSPQETSSAILDSRAKIVGYSLYQDSLESLGEILGRVRHASSALQIAGGHHSTFCQEELLSEFQDLDAVFLGFAENVLPDIVETTLRTGRLAGLPHVVTRKCVSTLPSPAKGHINLDSLPFPARDVIERASGRGKVLAIMTSRGCGGRCHFCSCWHFYHACGTSERRARSASNVMDEVEQLLVQHREDESRIHIVDDDFLGGPAPSTHARELAEEILQRRLDLSIKVSARADSVIENKSLLPFLREAGIDQVFLGVESGDDRALKRYGKGITVHQNSLALKLLRRNHMLDPTCGFIMFNAETTFTEIRSCLEFLENNGIADPAVIFWRVEVQPGTSLERRMRQRGLLLPGYSHRTPYAYRFEDERIGRLSEVFRRLRSRKLHEVSSLLYAHDRLVGSLVYAFKGRLPKRGKETLRKTRAIRKGITQTLYRTLGQMVDEAEERFRPDILERLWESGWGLYCKQMDEMHSAFLKFVNSLSPSQ